MKTLIFSFLILNIGFTKAQENTLTIKPKYSNLVIFISDFGSIEFYLYKPSVGYFDATKAKWITFI